MSTGNTPHQPDPQSWPTQVAGPASYGNPPPSPEGYSGGYQSGYQSGYGQQPYAQGYPGGYQTGYGQQPYAPAPRPTNTMAILALVFAFVFCPLGIVFGVIARNQIKRTGEGGEGLALAGLIVGSVFTALFILYIVFVFVAIGSAVSSMPT
jgi:hypothetical protein